MTVERIRSEMAATVTRVEASVGDDVIEGATLVVLEAMKMEMPVTAPVAGRVVELPVAAGALVATGDLLVALERD